MMMVIKMEKKMVLSQVRGARCMYLDYDAVAAIEEEEDDEDEVDGDKDDDGGLG